MLILIVGNPDPADLDEDPLAFWACPGCGALMTGTGYGPHHMACSPACGLQHALDLSAEPTQPETPPCAFSGQHVCPPECRCGCGVPW